MTDSSFLDNKYFIDKYIYNCPFCKRGNVTFNIKSVVNFDWTNQKKCKAIFVTCSSCSKDSMHLTFKELQIEKMTLGYRFKIEDGHDIDADIFYSVPT